MRPRRYVVAGRSEVEAGYGEVVALDGKARRLLISLWLYQCLNESILSVWAVFQSRNTESGASGIWRLKLPLRPEIIS
jgi:hypothetical protein